MQIYYHCTYKGSPVGFCIGKLDMEGQIAGNIELREENTNPFIRTCFNYGTVRKACGILPQEPSKYFLLAKKLAAQGKAPEEPEHYSINIALVTDSKNQFRSWLAREDGSELEIAETVKASMEINRSNNFGFTVRADQAASLAEKSFKSLFTGCEPQYAELETWVETSYMQTDLKQLAEDLELSEPDKEFQKSGSGKWVIYRKKTDSLQFDRSRWGTVQEMVQKESSLGSDYNSCGSCSAGNFDKRSSMVDLISKELKRAVGKLKEKLTPDGQ